MSNKDAHLGEVGEELLAQFAYQAKVNRTSLLAEFVDDAFNAAIKSMPPGEIAELHRRVSKLFLAAFKTPEMDKLVREKVLGSASLSAEQHVERLKPEIEKLIEKEISARWESLVVHTARAMLADALTHVAELYESRVKKAADASEDESVKEILGEREK